MLIAKRAEQVQLGHWSVEEAHRDASLAAGDVL